MEMPYKSRAQQRLFHHLVSQGKLAPEVAEEYDEASKGKKIPQFVKRKAFGGQVEAKEGVRCPACDYPLDSAPVALDAGEGCPRCGYGDAKDVPHKASGGEIQDVTAYRARGGEMSCAHCGSVTFVPMKAQGGEITDVASLYGDMKELYPRKNSGGAKLDDGKIRPFGQMFAQALKRGR
jgi:DNA-directed RNA polymerase subunit RPC12/RpoP